MSNTTNTPTNEELHAKLTDQLKSFYHPAMEADEFLTAISKNKMGQFSAIFAEDSGFRAKANRFLPYMEELVDDQQALPKPDEAGFDDAISQLINKFQLMHQVLAQFSEQLKEQK